MMKKLLTILIILLSFIFVSCENSHEHKYVAGICSCGEVDPNYEEIKYTVIFKDYDGAILSEVVVSKGEKIAFPPPHTC